jgi:hypothetical protein
LENAEEFQDYLRKTGVWGALGRCIIRLYEEENPPDDPIAHLCYNMESSVPRKVARDALVREIADLNHRVRKGF